MSGGLDENQLSEPEDIKVKIYDIKGYWDMSYSEDYNEDDMWEGQLILYEDGWFEGIVTDPKSPYTEDRFIFGAHFPDLAIELLKVTPSRYSDPFAFKGKRETNGYKGKFYVVGLLGEKQCGVCQIITKESEKQDVQELLTRVENWKKAIIGDQNSFLYQNFYKIRSQFVEVTKRKYLGTRFSKEEINDLEKAFEPVNKEVINQTVEAVYKLVKNNQPQDTKFGEDDDLPF